ncbi:MAG: serine/threonine protein kinase [Gemmataceae bacterium]
MDSQQVVNVLLELGLLPEEERVRAEVRQLQTHTSDAKAFTGELLKRDLLTPYQANQILTGKRSYLRVGPYLILERLGEGAMGQVFKARHTTTGQIDAVKVIRKEHVTNTIAVKRFLREVEAASKLNHPNVVGGHDAAQADGTYYFVMQLLNGLTLSQYVKKHGPLEIEQACDYMLQTALGLEHIFQAGMVHRDVKPSNLMILAPDKKKKVTPTDSENATSPLPGGDSRWGQVKLLDLGIARLSEEPDQSDPHSQLTQLGTVIGTAEHMAPEQALCGSSADTRSDIYSLGCTFYFALTGRPPFTGNNSVDIMLKHQLEKPRPANELRSGVPQAVIDILDKMMAKKREDRYQTPLEVATALQDAIATKLNAPIPVATRAPTIPVAHPAPPTPSRQPLAATSYLAGQPDYTQPTQQTAEPTIPTTPPMAHSVSTSTASHATEFAFHDPGAVVEHRLQPYQHQHTQHGFFVFLVLASIGLAFFATIILIWAMG